MLFLQVFLNSPLLVFPGWREGPWARDGSLLLSGIGCIFGIPVDRCLRASGNAVVVRETGAEVIVCLCDLGLACAFGNGNIGFAARSCGRSPCIVLAYPAPFPDVRNLDITGEVFPPLAYVSLKASAAREGRGFVCRGFLNGLAVLPVSAFFPVPGISLVAGTVSFGFVRSILLVTGVLIFCCGWRARAVKGWFALFALFTCLISLSAITGTLR